MFISFLKARTIDEWSFANKTEALKILIKILYMINVFEIIISLSFIWKKS
jgi:hypothetical protein